jgi:hypothetical protein
MDAMSAQDLLANVRGVRLQARRDRRATSVPLLVFGVLTVADAVLRSLFDPIGNLVLLLLAPVGFMVIARHYRRREIALGVGSEPRSYVIAAFIMVLMFVFLLPVLLIFGLFAAVGVGLLAIAVRQRNLYLAFWAVVYGVVGGLEGLSLISNRLYGVANALGWLRSSNGYFSWSSSLVYGVLGSMLIGAGLYARRQEVMPA